MSIMFMHIVFEAGIFCLIQELINQGGIISSQECLPSAVLNVEHLI